MKYSTDRAYRDMLIVEVQKVIKKIDDETPNSQLTFWNKMIIFLKKCLIYLKKLF